jgi:hypothetical protein
MHARQDAWSRAARSASASGSTSGSGSGSRSPSRTVELQMSSSFGATSGSAVAGEGSRAAEKKGRKKVAKACLACQKSHVTCDDSELFLLIGLHICVQEGLMIERPCTRCVKKGIGQQCTEGVRKKAKYLLEEDEKCMSPSIANLVKLTRQ